MKNIEFAKTNTLFQKCCELVKISPTQRQASKFINGRGIAFTQRKEAIRILKEKEILEETIEGGDLT